MTTTPSAAPAPAALRFPRLDGSRVLVLGTGPMGVATARGCLAEGARVVLAGRDPHRLDRARDATVGDHRRPSPSATSTHARLETLTVQPERAEDVEQLFARLRPDHTAVLMGAATTSDAYGIASTPLPDAQASFSRFWISYAVLRAAGRQVREGCSVTLLSGSSSRRPSEGRGFWGTLHGAVEALGRNAAWELAPLRVNVVSPGGINIDPPLRALVPDVGRGEDVAAAVVMLMAGPVMSGALVDVDGGEFLAPPSS